MHGIIELLLSTYPSPHHSACPFQGHITWAESERPGRSVSKDVRMMVMLAFLTTCMGGARKFEKCDWIPIQVN